MNNVILIPVLNPTYRTLNLIKDLMELEFNKIVVINDGSDLKSDIFFTEFKNLGCVVLDHGKNYGKGKAIKTGIKYIEENCGFYNGVITVDADGQHLPKDVYKVAKLLEENDDALIMGMRNFNNKCVPFKSKFGNKISSIVFKFSTGVKCSDTQTGLRGIPKKYYQLALNTEGNRYDFEMNFLTKVALSKIEIVSTNITTIYEEKNATSHFRPVKDAALIYRKPLRFTVASFTSSVIDITLFYIFTKVLNISDYYLIIVSTILARVISGFYNFLLNKNWCFNSHGKFRTKFIKYVIFFVATMMASSLLVALLSFLPIHLTIVKMIVDTALFIVSYVVQKKYIFN